MSDLIPRPVGRVDAVLDTDAYNEVDDQYAIAWFINEPERIRVKALYAAPFWNRRCTSPADGMEKSYNEIVRVLTLSGKEDMIRQVYRGSDRYMPDEQTPVDSDAARHLASLAAGYSPENPLYVLAIGVITNVASALLLAPEIAENIVIVWLGGHGHHYPHNDECNCRQNVAASRVVFDSKARLVQFPCMGVVDVLSITEPDLRFWLQGKNALCDYLIHQTVEEANRYAKGRPWSRIIWDISTVAWLLDTERKAVFDRVEPRPIAQYDHHYSFTPTRPPMNYVYELKRDRVFEAMIGSIT